MGREFPKHPVVGVGAVVLRLSAEAPRAEAVWEVLLVKRANPPSQGEWSLPGGVVELGERLEQAVIREVLEETGLEVEPVAMVEVLSHIVRADEDAFEKRDGVDQRVRFHYVLVDYACRVVRGEAIGATDALSVIWRPLVDLCEEGEFALNATTAEVIRKAVRLVDSAVPGQ